jgi:hypothetical protein
MKNVLPVAVPELEYAPGRNREIGRYAPCNVAGLVRTMPEMARIRNPAHVSARNQLHNITHPPNTHSPFFRDGWSPCE